MMQVSCSMGALQESYPFVSGNPSFLPEYFVRQDEFRPIVN